MATLQPPGTPRSTSARSGARRRLPRRDFVILPLLSLLTILAMLGGAEFVARLAMPEQSVDQCLVPDRVLGERPRPMCVSHTKSAEGDWVENRYNDCGYRSEASCATPADGAPRLVVLGSSMSWGLNVPTQQTWYVRLADMLSRSCGRRIDVQNLSGVFNLTQIAARVPEALALKPAVAVMILTPFDLEGIPSEKFVPGEADPTRPDPQGLRKLQIEIVSARAVVAAQHFIFRQPSTYVPLYLRYGDKADFLRPPFTPAWRRRLAYADQALGYMADKLHAAGVPFVVVFVPQEAQADIVATQQSIPGVDPFAFGAALGAIAREHGIVYNDLTPRFSTIHDAPDLYLNVDAHMNGRGNALEAEGVKQALTGEDGVPAFAACLCTTGN
ncbi:MAG TPA: hypothetical protein VHT04_12770 [Stellaceae bacterium]|nr:hypothetical protein [Stellaceae bacterium]